MKKLKTGVLGPADIAMRRMIPAICASDRAEFVGVAVRPEGNHKKASEIRERFGGRIFDGYESMLDSEEIDSVYIALPPALHCKWALRALQSGKHVLLEKPFATSLAQTEELISTARDNSLAVTENFAFIYHRQISCIKEIIDSGRLGQLRTIRTCFGFPLRGKDDFRYIKDSGGGALLDCGCYTIRLVTELLGEGMVITDSALYATEGFDVDIYGAISAHNDTGVIAQMSFGMDQQYDCSVEIWGSAGMVSSPRIYTAPPDLNVKLRLSRGSDTEEISVLPDDQFRGSLEAFAEMVTDEDLREKSYNAILRQSRYMDQVMKNEEFAHI